jgi:predicted nucleotidyltransferase
VPPNPRWALAEQVADALRERHGRHLQAIAVHGSLAHGDDTDTSDVDLVVVTRSAGSTLGRLDASGAGAGPRPGRRRVAGVLLEIGVISATEYLAEARTLTVSWPLAADRYITTKALHDPDGWLPGLRDAHLAHLARADAGTFAGLAREAWCAAASDQAKARRLAEWYETDSAMLVLAQARLGVALVEGLLTRTYFRNGADAVKRVGVASSHSYELADRLAAQAAELARRGYPVDAEVDDLL